MIKIELNYNNAYKWYNFGNTYVIGHLFYDNVLYQNETFINFVSQLSIKELKTIVSKSSGFFSIVIADKDKVTLISDIVRSFPVFYKVNKNNILITDNINQFKLLENDSIEELLMLRYVTADKTLYSGVYQLENSEILTVTTQKKILKEKYFYFKNNNPKNFDKKQKFKEFDEVLICVFKKMIKYLNGRIAVIPLSGGQDSRMIAYYLKKLNYPNIITYTYGNKNGAEVHISKQVAEYLNLKWIFIPYKRKSMSRKYNSKEIFENLSNYCGRGFSIPCIQEWEAIEYLLDKKIINNNCVLIPGHAMDFIAGNHIRESLLDKDVSLETVREIIYKDNYNLYKGNTSKFDLKLAKKLNIKQFEGTKISNLDACNYLENWDFEERQTKFISNSIRIYDYYSLNWYLPYWDMELVIFLKNIPINLRYKRKFFNDFTYYKYSKLMEKAPAFKPTKRKKYKGIKRRINNIYTVVYLYFNDPLNYYGYFKFYDYIYMVFKYKSLSYDLYVALDYIKLLKKD